MTCALLAGLRTWQVSCVECPTVAVSRLPGTTLSRRVDDVFKGAMVEQPILLLAYRTATSRGTGCLAAGCALAAPSALCITTAGTADS
jgi:hypothetical protein